MARRRRSLHEPVDYLRRKNDRRKLTNYLRTGNFKKIGGSRMVGSCVFRRRMAFCLLAVLIFGVGAFFAVF